MEEPLQLIEFINDDTEGITLQYDNLERILSRTENRPLCVICVAGPSRQGKSFVLGYMIRCLQALEKEETDWMDWENKDKMLSGFKFRNGTKPETQGIWMWSKPFLINVGEEETPVAVLLVDTQGTYDEHISARTTASIVGISLLMSSCMVFNFFKNLQEDVLTSLDSYIKYGQLALQGSDSSMSSKPFQKLTFLIRDWNNPAEYPYGSKGGKKFLDDKLALKPDQSPEARSVREAIKACFQTLDCYLMPHPGESAIMPDFKGSIQELHIAFAKKLEDFISNLINPDDLGDTSIKTVFGNAITASEFHSYLETYISIFNSKEIPSPVSLLDATVHITNQNVLQKSLRKYQDVLRSHQRTKKYLSEDDMIKADKQARKQGLSFFKSLKKFGNSEQLQELEEELEKMIDKQWKEVQKTNKEKRAKFITTEVEASLKTFKEELDFDFPLLPEDPLEYYEEATIMKKAKSLLQDVLNDFREKIDDEQENESSLNELCSEIETKLSDYLQNKVLLENQSRLKNAEKGIQELLQNLVKEYSDNLCDYFEANPFSDITGNERIPLHETHDRLKNDLKEKYIREKVKFAAKGKKEPNFPEGSNDDFNRRLSEAFTSITAAHTVKFQQHQQAADKVIQDLVNLYQNDMESAFLTDIHELQEWRDKNFQNYEGMFETQCKFPKDTSIFKDKLALLHQKLEGINQAAINELDQKEKAAKQQVQAAIEDSFNIYHVEMTKRLKGKPYVSADELQQWSFECIKSCQNRYKEYPIPTVNLQSEGMDTLTEKLAQDFAQLSLQHQQNIELIQAEAKNLVVQCHESYQKEMKTCMERVRTEEKLKEGHAISNENSVKLFKQKCNVKEDAFIEPYIQELKKDNEEAFEELLELFELKMGEEETITAGAIAYCRRLYNDEMEKHFKNQEFHRPNDLQNLHEAIAKRCVEDCNKKTPLTQGQRVELMEALEESFKKWKEQNDMNLESEDIAIGIDLGTTYSCVAVYVGGKIRIIPNLQGKNTTPSYVAFQADGTEVVGEPAKSRAYENPENTIFDAKRIIGRKMTDPKLQEDMKYWAFTVEDDSGIPKINIRGKKYYPEQISAKILKEMKDSAEKFLMRNVSKAVITVPAYFTDGQRQATKDAGELAGLEVLMVLTEPVAAAMAYKKQHADTFGQQDVGGHRNTLIFDLGGGTFDVACLKSKQGELETLAVDGDDHLGGEDFDRALMEYCAIEFKKQHGIDLLDGKDSTVKQTRDDVRRRLKRLQGQCERKKIELTSAREVEVTVDSIFGSKDLKVKVSRDKFEEMNQHLFRKTLDGVEGALASANIKKEDIHDIILVGGSTRIPKVREMLSTYFGGKALDCSINPDEAVAFGAAMKAAIMNGAITRENTDFTKIQDVTPMSIGVEVYGGGFSIIIPKSTKIPVKAKERYRTAHNNQTSVQVTIYQGEDNIAIRNKHLGDFYLNGIPPRDAEMENIDVEMIINAQGILHVSAVCSSTGGSTGIRVTENKQRMSRAVIQRLLDEACAV